MWWRAVVGAALGVAVAMGVGVALRAGSDTADVRPVQRAAASSPSAGPTETPTASPTGSPGLPPGQDLPVTLQAPGWTCGPAADEKFICRNGETEVEVIVRPASSHEEYLTDPDKADPAQYVSDVHDGVFATLSAWPDDTTTDVQALGALLVWR